MKPTIFRNQPASPGASAASTGQAARFAGRRAGYLWLVCLLLLIACQSTGGQTGGQPDQSASGLTGSRWLLATFGPEVAVQPAGSISAQFDAGTLSGSAGCNSYRTSYVVDGRSFAVGPIAVTEMACADTALMDQEAAYLAALASATRYELADDSLTMAYDGGRLHFIPDSPRPLAPLEGTIWQLEIVEQQDETVVMAQPVPDGMRVTITFQAGHMGGNTGCNAFGAPYQLDGRRLTIGAIVKTEALCPSEAEIAFEAQLFAGLAAAESLAIAGDRLTIGYLGGDLLFRAESGPGEAFPDQSRPVGAAEAEQTLTTFFDHLHHGRYTAAVALYGGSYETMLAHNPEFDPGDQAGLLAQACMVNGAICRPVRTAVFSGQPSPGTFEFQVTFANDDGSALAIELPGQPAQTRFSFRVHLTEAGDFRVISALAYSP